MPIYFDYRNPQLLDVDADAIRNAIKNILCTDLGSLPGKPEFGSRLKHILFEHADDITIELAKRVITEAISKWEDRIIVTNVEITHEDAYNKFIINISYNYKDTGISGNALVSMDIS